MMIWVATLVFVSGAHLNIPMDENYANRAECIAGVTELLKKLPDLPEPESVECDQVPEHDDSDPEPEGKSI